MFRRFAAAATALTLATPAPAEAPDTLVTLLTAPEPRLDGVGVTRPDAMAAAITAEDARVMSV